MRARARIAVSLAISPCRGASPIFTPGVISGLPVPHRLASPLATPCAPTEGQVASDTLPLTFMDLFLRTSHEPCVDVCTAEHGSVQASTRVRGLNTLAQDHGRCSALAATPP